MIMFFFACMIASTLTMHAVDLIAVQNNSDALATIHFIQQEGPECQKTLLVSIEPKTTIVLDEAIFIPIALYQFSNFEEVTEYLEIVTKRGIFFCAEGEIIEKSLSFFGLWLQKESPSPRDQKHPQILAYTGGLSRFGTPTPPPDEDELLPRRTRLTAADGAAGASTPSITLIIDPKGNISAH